MDKEQILYNQIKYSNDDIRIDKINKDAFQQCNNYLIDILRKENKKLQDQSIQLQHKANSKKQIEWEEFLEENNGVLKWYSPRAYPPKVIELHFADGVTRFIQEKK